MDERDMVQGLDWSQRSLTRRVALGLLAGGMGAVAWNEIGLTRKRHRSRKQPSRVRAEAMGGATQRPISDFLDAQGSTQQFVGEVRDVVGWLTPSADPVLFAWIDYVGVAEEFLGDLGTTTSGKVTERTLKDGRAEVHVVLHTRNALAWVIELDFSCIPTPPGTDFTCVFDQIMNTVPIFGFRPREVDAGQGEPSLVDSTLEVTFVNSAPGADLPDLVTIDPANLIFEKFRAHGGGTIREPETRPGRLTVVQTGVRLDRPDKNFFPAEIIKVQPTGR